MSAPALKRGAAYLAADGTIKVFCDGGYRSCTVEEAERLRDQLDTAITQAQGPHNCGCSGEIHYACRVTKEPKA